MLVSLKELGYAGFGGSTFQKEMEELRTSNPNEKITLDAKDCYIMGGAGPKVVFALLQRLKMDIINLNDADNIAVAVEKTVAKTVVGEFKTRKELYEHLGKKFKKNSYAILVDASGMENVVLITGARKDNLCGYVYGRHGFEPHGEVSRTSREFNADKIAAGEIKLRLPEPDELRYIKKVFETLTLR